MMTSLSRILQRLALSRSRLYCSYGRRKLCRLRQQANKGKYSFYTSWVPFATIPPFMQAFVVSVFRSSRDDDDAFYGSGDGDPANDRNHELFYAAKMNDAYTIDKLIKSGANPNERHHLGWTALHVAAFHGCSQAIIALLDNGAHIDCQDEFSTFREVSSKVRLSMTEVLCERQNQFSARLRTNANYNGTTPLHYAVLGDNFETVDLFIKRGADPTVVNEAGHSVTDYVRDPRIKNSLESYIKEFEKIKKKRDLEERIRYPLEHRLKEHIIGQESAIATVAATIRRKQNGWYDDEHPLVLLFLGSSGIGKTELAKQVARYLHKDLKTGFIRLDMSEYQQAHEVAKFIGSPPGYVGHDEGGQLTTKLKQCPNAVVLFDEVEKAHPRLLTILLQLFDEGRLTDGKGETVECKDAIFIMTSNLAAEEIADYVVKLREDASLQKEHESDNLSDLTVSKKFKEQVVRPILKNHFKLDEFLGRITEMVYFLPFSRPELMALVTKELEIWKQRAMKNHRIDISWDRNVLHVLADGYNVHYGARSIKHEVERRVANKLADAFEKQMIKEGSCVKIFTNYDLIQDASEADAKVKRDQATIEFDILNTGTTGAMPITDKIKKAISGLI